MPDADAKKKILARRAAFVAAALTGVSVAGACSPKRPEVCLSQPQPCLSVQPMDEDAGPQPCLEPPPPPNPDQPETGPYAEPPPGSE